METTVPDVDLHRLELRFADARLEERQAIERLARSIDRCGQRVPCTVVVEPDDRLVLIDGYRRVAALRQLGRDTARVERWSCDLATAVIVALTRAQGRAFAAIEEAMLLRELVAVFGVSQHELARQCGRDVSWISRRLQLVDALPETALAAVRVGRLSCWAASRIIVPLARANTQHADRLLASLQRQPMSTRDLRRWFEHYQTAGRAIRDRMVGDPQLFTRALQETREATAGAELRDGPEGQCLADLQRIEGLLTRLAKRLPVLMPLPTPLAAAVLRVSRTVAALTNAIERSADHDQTRDPHQRADPEGTGAWTARDRSAAGAGAQHGAQHPA
jgi:ParB/RepB/Spo0J family partition protein